jgi:hypothetical protein
VTAPYPTNTDSSNQTGLSASHQLNTIEPSLEDAAALVSKLRDRLANHGNKRLLQAFTALADGDQAVGLLAFYLWRRNARRRT